MTLNYLSSVWVAAFLVGGALAAWNPRSGSCTPRQGPLVLSVLAGFAGVIMMLRPTMEQSQVFAGLVGLMSGRVRRHLQRDAVRRLHPIVRLGRHGADRRQRDRRHGIAGARRAERARRGTLGGGVSRRRPTSWDSRTFAGSRWRPAVHHQAADYGLARGACDTESVSAGARSQMSCTAAGALRARTGQLCPYQHALVIAAAASVLSHEGFGTCTFTRLKRSHDVLMVKLCPLQESHFQRRA